MKYMHSEWRDRLENWIHALAQDLYLPLGPLPVEAFETAERLSPAQTAGRRFAPLAEGSPWGDGYAYCWMRGSVTLPEAAKGKRIVLDLPTGGETSVFVDGLSFGTYRASGMDEPHHYLVDNALTRDGQPGRRYNILLEAYAGHYFPQSPLAACATGPVLPGSYQDPLAGKKRAVLGRLSFGIWNEDAYQLYLDLKTLWLLCCEQDPESLRADKLAKALEQATLLLDFEQPLEGRLRSYQAARALLAPLLAAHNGSTAPGSTPSATPIWTWPGCGPWRKPTARPPAPSRPSCACWRNTRTTSSCKASRPATPCAASCIRSYTSASARRPRPAGGSPRAPCGWSRTPT